jgi:hypothetical protein
VHLNVKRSHHVSNDKKKKDLARIIAGRMSPRAPQDIDAVRSLKGQIKGALTKDTLYRLRQVVADHQKAGKDEDPEIGNYRLTIIMGLCGDYLSRHGKETDERAREKMEAVEKIQADAMVERARRQAEAQYLQDAYAKKSENSPTRMGEQTSSAVQYADLQAKKLGAGQAGTQEGFNQATLALIKDYGLTEAEILAVKVYTASDYKYINPATANNESWMKSQARPENNGKHGAKPSKTTEDGSEADRDLTSLLETTPEADRDLSNLLETEADRDLSNLLGTEPDRDLSNLLGTEPDRDLTSLLETEPDRDLTSLLEASPEADRELAQILGDVPDDYFATAEGKSHLRRLFEEGSLHGALAISALRKLPPMQKRCFRGTRLTEKEFNEKFGTPDNPNRTPKQVEHLTSVATTREAAEAFADGQDCSRLDATVSVLTCLDVKTGRDIGDLSIFGRKEKECLLLPGIFLQTDSVEEFFNGTVGKPKAKKWFVVQAHEVQA